MRLPRVVVYGLPLCVAVTLVTLLAGEPKWLAAVVLLTGMLVVFTVASLQEGSDPVVAGTLRWRGGERRALLVPYSRWKVAWLSFVLVSAFGLIGFVVVMVLLPHWEQSWPNALGIALTAAFTVGASAPVIALAIGPNQIAMLPEGFLVRRGYLSHFIPWAAIADVTKADSSWAYEAEMLRLTVRNRALIQSNWLGRVWRTLRMDQGLTIPLVGLRVAGDEVVSAVFDCWQNPEITQSPISAPTASPISPASRSASRPPLPSASISPGGAMEMVIEQRADFAILYADEAQNRYVQVQRGSGGQLYAEAVSNTYLLGEAELGTVEIETLAGLGWQAPGGPHENFSITLPVASVSMGRTTDLLLRTLRDVYGLPPGQEPLVELGSGPSQKERQPAGRDQQRLWETVEIADYLLTGIRTVVNMKSGKAGYDEALYVLVPSLVGGVGGAIIGTELFPGTLGWSTLIAGLAGVFLGVLPHALFVALVTSMTRPGSSTRILAAVVATGLLWAGPLLLPIGVIAALSG